MKRYILLLIWIVGMQINAQDIMRITAQDGTRYELSINNIKEFNFYIFQPIDVVAEWVYITELGLACYDIKEDGTFTQQDFSYNLGTISKYDGTYTNEENVIKLLHNNETMLVVPIMESSETKIVSESGDVYYRVQEQEYNLTTNDHPSSIGNEGDVLRYVDNCIVGSANGMIVPLREGRGYAIVEDAETGDLKAYGISVSYVPESPVDWAQYFKKKKEEVEVELGEYDFKNEEKCTFTYINYSASIEYLVFGYNEETGEITEVNLIFYDEEKRLNYCDSIEKHYVLNASSSSRKVYYNTEDPKAAMVKVTVYDASIVYTDMKTTPVSVIDWTQYFKKSRDEIMAEFGSNPLVTEDDEYEEYEMLYTNVKPLKSLTFTFTKGFEKVTDIRVRFNDENSMQGYCNAIAEKYILDAKSTDTRKTYYDAEDSSSASVKIVITSSSSSIAYADKSE